VRAQIDSEASSIDASISTPAGPGLRTRKVSTEFNVASGETIVLSGLLSRETSTDIDKVPLLGDLPVLGALFRSTRFQNKETELVVFVTPTVVDSHTPELAERVRRTGEKLARTMNEPPYLSQPLQAGRDAGSFTPVPGPAASAAPLPAPGFESAGGSLLVVTSPEALLRASPQPGAAVLLTLGRGAAVRMGAQPVTGGDEDGNRWRQVLVGEVRGWIAAGEVQPVSRAAGTLSAAPEAAVDSAGPLLEPLSTPAAASTAAVHRLRVTAERLALRVTPDINAPVLSQLRAGTVVQAQPQAQRGRWSAVQAGELRGWAASHWLVPDDKP